MSDTSPTVRSYLSQHEQECFMRRDSYVVSFAFYRGDELLNVESYLCKEDGRSRLLRAPVRSVPRERFYHIQEDRPMTLDELLERVEKATGPNLQLECDLCAALESERLEVGLKPPNYTYSLDKALALVETKLPGWDWSIGKSSDGYEVELFGPQYSSTKQDPATFAVWVGPTPALALIAALLKCLIAQQQKD